MRGLPSRVVMAGHLDTVPIADNVPSRREGDVLWGCGTVDMKSGDAVFLHLAATVADPAHDLTLIFYDCEEIAAEFNGLNRIERDYPEWLHGDVAILGEPSDGFIEAGCQGTLRARVRTHGVRAHSARAWLGVNAIHALAPILQRLSEYRPREVDLDGCVYREGLSAVGVTGGVSGNIVPDEAAVTVNFRFAPDRDVAGAFEHVRAVFDGLDVELELTDGAPGALPGLSAPAAAELVRAAGGRVRAKYGWTDVSRFAALGIPAVNYGPGNPQLAHKRDERVETAKILAGEERLRAWLTG
jgi:succinyl-diaminopimelate desuccinylase